jgi:Uma2 family endonuclease
MSTAAKIITADQLFRMPDDGFRYELWEGELRQMTPAGFQHGAIASSLASHLSQWAAQAPHQGEHVVTYTIELD